LRKWREKPCTVWGVVWREKSLMFSALGFGIQAMKQ